LAQGVSLEAVLSPWRPDTTQVFCYILVVSLPTTKREIKCLMMS